MISQKNFDIQQFISAVNPVNFFEVQGRDILMKTNEVTIHKTFFYYRAIYKSCMVILKDSPTHSLSQAKSRSRYCFCPNNIFKLMLQFQKKS